MEEERREDGRGGRGGGEVRQHGGWNINFWYDRQENFFPNKLEMWVVFVSQELHVCVCVGGGGVDVWMCVCHLPSVSNLSFVDEITFLVSLSLKKKKKKKRSRIYERFTHMALLRNVHASQTFINLTCHRGIFTPSCIPHNSLIFSFTSRSPHFLAL